MGFFGSNYTPPKCSECRTQMSVVDKKPASSSSTKLLLKCPKCGEGGVDIVGG